MSSLNKSDVIELSSGGKMTPGQLADLAKELQAGLNQSSVSPEFLDTVKNYLNKIDSFLPKPAVRNPATDDILWKEGDTDKCLVIHETLAAICNHPELNGDNPIWAKALRLMITLMLYVPGLDNKIRKSNESA